MNHVKDLLKAGNTAIGTSASTNSEIGFLADSGFDFLLFDTQHSPDDLKALGRPLAATRGRKAIPIVRVAENRADQICFALDAGAKGIVAPMINTGEEAADMVKFCKYPFEGVRSSAGARGEWGEFGSYREYMDAVNEQLLIIPMIETRQGLENIGSILAVPGIDVLLIGPSDFSINLDVPLDYQNPIYHDALVTVASACKEAGVVPGMYFVPPGIEPDALMRMGYRFFTLPWRAWAAAGVREGLSKIR